VRMGMRVWVDRGFWVGVGAMGWIGYLGDECQ